MYMHILNALALYALHLHLCNVPALCARHFHLYNSLSHVSCTCTLWDALAYVQCTSLTLNFPCGTTIYYLKYIEWQHSCDQKWCNFKTRIQGLRESNMSSNKNLLPASLFICFSMFSLEAGDEPIVKTPQSQFFLFVSFNFFHCRLKVWVHHLTDLNLRFSIKLGQNLSLM